MASHAARLVLLLALAAALAGRSEGAWCVCRTDLPDATLQRTLDYACGTTADCKPIQPSAACFASDNVKAHCSYAVNSFYQRIDQNPLACVFSGTAALSPIDPSSNGCQYPANTSAALTGVDIPPGPVGQGPSGPLNDNSSGADMLPVVAGTGKRAVILVCCFLLASSFRIRIKGVFRVTMILVLILLLTLAHAHEVNTSSAEPPEQRPLLAGAELPLPEAPQASVFHPHPQRAPAVASAQAVASTLVLSSILLVMLMA